MLLENENMGDYEFEKKVLNSAYNKASFYIPGKEIIIDENSNIKFHPIDDIDDFNYSQDIEEEYLFDEYQLTVDEKNAISHRGQALRKLLAELPTWWKKMENE